MTTIHDDWLDLLRRARRLVHGPDRSVLGVMDQWRRLEGGFPPIVRFATVDTERYAAFRATHGTERRRLRANGFHRRGI